MFAEKTDIAGLLAVCRIATFMILVLIPRPCQLSGCQRCQTRGQLQAMAANELELAEQDECEPDFCAMDLQN